MKTAGRGAFRGLLAGASGFSAGSLLIALLLLAGVFRSVYAPTVMVGLPLLGLGVAVALRRRLSPISWAVTFALVAGSLVAVATCTDPLG